ncbi:hypothetical protein BurJ1DRAFT_0424 [Burkholderiales bacterium JOSHI_001]|nr:hypothetical protein BurJ1DRAFT_0424 [Burkholderiales bacterium JOSHI_001]
MSVIESHHMVDAIRRVQRMDLRQREQLAEEVHARQPQLFFSVLALQRHGATLEQLEVVLNLLLVFHEAMKGSGLVWPVISEAVQERCLARIAGRLSYAEGLTPELHAQAASDASSNPSEPVLLAYAIATLQDEGLAGIKTEAEKFLMLAALNLVACIAETAPQRVRPK